MNALRSPTKHHHASRTPAPLRWAGAVLLLLLLFGRLAATARALSFTSDEPSHIASGYAFLARGATWTMPLRGHPLLADAWLALPFYLGRPDIPVTTLDGWGRDNTRFVQAFVPYLQANVAAAEAATRVPVMALTVLLAAVVTRWATDLARVAARDATHKRGGGPAMSGLVALTVMVLDPTLLAHGMLATNDAATTALGTLGLFLTYRFVRRPALRRLPAAGLVLGLTLLAKGSGVLWLAGGLAMVGVAGLRDVVAAPRRGRVLARWAGYAAGLAGLALLATWLCYGFEVGPLPGLDLPVPAPTHWRSILTQAGGAEARWTYFLGRVRQGGDGRYFPVAALIKNPLPLLILAAWGGLRGLLQWRTWGRRLGVPGAALFPLLYTGVAIWSGVNIGYRHMLPVHPFLYLLVGGLFGAASTPPSAPRRGPSPSALLAAALIGWLAVGSALTGPYFLSYFSPLVGGAEEGWRYLADSNTDWGQAYKQLRAWQVAAGARAAPLRFSGPKGYIGLRTYGVDYAPLPPMAEQPAPVLAPALYPAPGTYAISANSLSGLGAVAPDNYAWFRYHTPDTVIGNVLYVYRVAPLNGPTWLAQCTTPAAPLTEAAIATGFAQPPARRLAFDCAQTWVYPGAAATRGWYALHAGTLAAAGAGWARMGLRPPQPSGAFTARHTAGLAPSYAQWDDRELPAFVLYDGAAEMPALPAGAPAYTAPAEAAPATLRGPSALPVGLDGPLAYLGSRAYLQDGGLEVETWWQVTAESLAQPFSVMAHLLDSQGQALGVADGLGVAPGELRQGDVVVQAHRFAGVTAADGLWLRTGGYGLDDGARWTTADGAGDAIFVPLAEVAP